MSLLKIPFVLTFAYAFHFSGSPPPGQGITSATDEARQNYLAKRMDWYECFLAIAGPLLKCFLWLESFMEISTIVYCCFFAAAGSVAEEAQSNILIQFTQTPANYIFDCDANLPLTWTYFSGWILVMLAALIRRQCYRTLGPMFTFKVVLQRDHRLVTTGPYSIVRHPGYAAFIALVCGVTITHAHNLPFLSEHTISLLQRMGQWYTFVFVITLIFGLYSLIKRADIEDGFLRDKFGDGWVLYSQRVRCKFIPLLW